MFSNNLIIYYWTPVLFWNYSFTTEMRHYRTTESLRSEKTIMKNNELFLCFMTKIRVTTAPYQSLKPSRKIISRIWKMGSALQGTDYNRHVVWQVHTLTLYFNWLCYAKFSLIFFFLINFHYVYRQNSNFKMKFLNWLQQDTTYLQQKWGTQAGQSNRHKD